MTFLLRSAETENRPRRERAMRRHNNRRRSAFDRKLLEHERIRDVIKTRAAVLLGKEDTEHPEPREFVDRIGRISMRAVSLDAYWPQLLAGKAAGNVASASLRFSEFEIHSIHM